MSFNCPCQLACFCGDRQTSMQARTQSAWQDGAQDVRPQHCTEHCRCWAEELQASCAALASGRTTVAAAATATDSQFIRNDI